MANNRLWAVCKDDNKCKMITKYYASCPWDLPEDVLSINNFLKEHEQTKS